ncbi:MAG: HAMP domain-containing histidine kinase [Clostridia bacterium]|nr:HAMP domain-containing histidine kinase [Clostridia bacterium]
MKNTTRHTSIVNRLHGHYRRQKFFAALLLDLAAVVLVFVTWALAMENAVGLNPFRLHNRWISAASSFELTDPDLFFRGMTYHVENGGIVHSFEMFPVVKLIFILLVVLAVLQIVGSFIGSASDRHTIRRILRPIDDIALTAERLSGSTGKLFSDSGEEASLQELAAALDHIDDLSEDPRITVKESELAGLEAAVNNMLRRLSQSQKRQIRFVDDASHELRTPIAVIQGYVGMLDRWGKEDPRVMEESIAAIKSEAEHMKTLVDQLLFLARGESDRLELKMETVDGCEILRELWEEYQMIDPEHQYDLRLPRSVPVPEGSEPDVPPKEAETLPLRVTADPALLKQSLRTMLDNARKFTPAGGAITLTARATSSEGQDGSSGKAVFQRSEEVFLEIADSGIGIPPEDLPRIFDRFWRGAAARSGVSGSGLGLSIAKWIVERHGGRIDAASAPGLGTRIGVALPRKPEL